MRPTFYNIPVVSHTCVTFIFSLRMSSLGQFHGLTFPPLVTSTTFCSLWCEFCHLLCTLDCLLCIWQSGPFMESLAHSHQLQNSGMTVLFCTWNCDTFARFFQSGKSQVVCSLHYKLQISFLEWKPWLSSNWTHFMVVEAAAVVVQGDTEEWWKPPFDMAPTVQSADGPLL